MPVPGISVTATPNQLPVGESTTIRWQVDNATSAELLDFTSSQWKPVALSGSRSYTLTGQGTFYFHIRATGPGGTSQNNARVDTSWAAKTISPAQAAVTPAVTVNGAAQSVAATPVQSGVPTAVSASTDFGILEQEAIGGIKNKYLLLAAAVGILYLFSSSRSK